MKTATPSHFLSLVQTALIGTSTSHRPKGIRSSSPHSANSGPSLVDAALVHAQVWPEWNDIKLIIAQNTLDEQVQTIANMRLANRPFFLADEHIGYISDQSYMTAHAAAERMQISYAVLQKRLQRKTIPGAIQAPNQRWLIPCGYVKSQYENKNMRKRV